MARYDKHTWVDGELITALLMNHHEEALENFAENIIDIQNIEDKIDASVLHIVPDSLRIVRYDELTDWDRTGIDKNAAQATARINIDAAALANIAPAYSNTKIYKVGDYCSYNNKVYCCKIATQVPVAQNFEVSTTMEVDGETQEFNWSSNEQEGQEGPFTYTLSLPVSGAIATDLISVTNITTLDNDLVINATTDHLNLTYQGSVAPGSVTITGILYHTGSNNGTITIAAIETSNVQTPEVNNEWNYTKWDEAILTDKLAGLNEKVQNATINTAGLMTAADKQKLDGFNTADQYALKSDITNVYKYCGSVATYNDLPDSELTAGDIYNVVDTDMNYAWTGTGWDALGNMFQIPTASNSVLGGIKINGGGLAIDANGVASVTNGLPEVTNADAYKQLMVVDGQWEVVSLYDAAAGHYF